MGRHYGYDMSSRPRLSGFSDLLMPVVPMYSNGSISAVLFFTDNPQKIYPVGQWEGPFPRFLFCKNFCSNDCMKHESSMKFYTTMHFLFHDPALNLCDER